MNRCVESEKAQYESVLRCYRLPFTLEEIRYYSEILLIRICFEFEQIPADPNLPSKVQSLTSLSNPEVNLSFDLFYKKVIFCFT